MPYHRTGGHYMKVLGVLGVTIDLVATIGVIVLAKNYFLKLSKRLGKLTIIALPMYVLLLIMVITIGLTIAVVIARNLLY